MRNKEQKGDLSVQAIAGTHVVLLGIDLVQQKCPGLLGFALRREDHTEGEDVLAVGIQDFCQRRAVSTARDALLNTAASYPGF